MKLCTTEEGTLMFNGNAKSSRIKAAAVLLYGDNPVIKTVLSMRGVDPDGAAIRRYARRIKQFRALGKNLPVTVSVSN